MTTSKTRTTKREYLGTQLVKLGQIDQLTLGCHGVASDCGCGWHRGERE